MLLKEMRVCEWYGVMEWRRVACGGLYMRLYLPCLLGSHLGCVCFCACVPLFHSLFPWCSFSSVCVCVHMCVCCVLNIKPRVHFEL